VAQPRPALRTSGDWSTDLGSRSRFVIQIPVLKPTLNSVVVERQPGVIVWGFEDFQGRDRWECQPIAQGTRLVNRFEFEIPNLIRWVSIPCSSLDKRRHASPTATS